MEVSTAARGRGGKHKVTAKVVTHTYGPAEVLVDTDFRTLLASMAAHLDCQPDNIMSGTMQWKAFKPGNALVLPLVSDTGLKVMRNHVQLLLKKEPNDTPCVHVFMDPPNKPRAKVSNNRNNEFQS